MSLHRFKFICHLIKFQNKETRTNCWKPEKSECMRELFEDMNERNVRMRQLYNTIQYNTNKPGKCDLLYRSLCDSSIPYTYYSLPYAGKPEKVESPAAKYYITETNEYSK